MATAEWETYVLTGRFKSERRKKREVKEGRDKKLIQKYKELRKLMAEQDKLGYTDLIPPVQRGWKRFFVLRPDVMISKESDFFLQLLEKINTTTFSHRKDFKMKRRRHGKKVDVERIQKLREFYTYELKKIKLTEKEMLYFKMEWKVTDRGHLIPVYVFTEPWRFILCVKPNMITKVRVIDPQLKSREREIDSYFDRNKLYPRLFKLIKGRYSDRCRWKDHDKAKHKAILETDLLNEINQ
jgi:hypothetical protein